MKKESKQIGKLPASAIILGAKGYRRNGKLISIIKYRFNNEVFMAWIPEGGTA